MSGAWTTSYRAFQILAIAACLSLCLSVQEAFALEVAQKRNTLVVLDSKTFEQSHAKYLDLVRDQAKKVGGKVETVLADDSNWKLREWDEWLYDSLILLAPEATEIGKQSLSDVVTEFIEAGNSVFLVGSEDMSSETRALAASCGVEFSETANGAVVDHFQHQEGDVSVLKATNYMDDRGSVFRKTSKDAPLLWKGIGQSISPDNELAFSAVTGFSTSYCPTKSGAMSKKKGLKKFTGTDVSLVSLVQARNNARVAITGSLSMLSDAYLNNKEASNLYFSEDVTSWVLGYHSLLRYREFAHKQKGGETKDVYRIKDELVVSMRMEEWDSLKQKWTPYNGMPNPEGKEVQVELTMLSPHVRKTFSKVNKEGVLTTEMTAPDVYGVFKFVVDYNCRGYSYIHLEEQIPIRPFRHDEYERFIVAAYPYYASILSSMAAFFIFGFAILYTK